MVSLCYLSLELFHKRFLRSYYRMNEQCFVEGVVVSLVGVLKVQDTGLVKAYKYCEILCFTFLLHLIHSIKFARPQ